MKQINSRRKALIGEVHEWQGGKFRKTLIGWERVTEEKMIEHNSIIEKLVYELEPRILDSLDKWEEAFELQFERPMSNFDREMSRLTMLSDAVNAFEKYTKPTDQLTNLRSHPTPKGSYEISATIIRDSKEYPFWTEVIYAGGYNIQRLHFRYLVKTNIPQTGVKTMATQITEKIKRLSKLEKLQKEIEYFQSVIDRRLKENDEINSMTDDELANTNEYWRDNFSKLTWEELVKRGVNKTSEVYSTEDKFKKEQQKYRQSIIDGKRNRVQYNLNNNKDTLKDIKKVQSKIDQLVSVI